MNFQDLPLDVHQAIASHLEVEDLILSYITASKTINLIALECLKVVRKNTVDVMVTGLHRAGVSGLFSKLLTNDVHHRPTWRSLNAVNDIYKVEVGSGCYANIFHPNTYHRSRLGSFPLYGLTQCVVLVIGADADLKAARELLCSIYGMSGHMNIIFFINKLDLIQYSHQRYNELCQSLTEECRKLSEALANNISFIPSAFGSSILPGQTTPEMPWYSGQSLCSKLAEISRTVRVPVYKYFRPANIILIMSRKLRPEIELDLQSKLKLKPFGSKAYFRLVVGYLTDGVVSVGETIWMHPLHYQRGQLRGVEAPKFACTVHSIQYFNQYKRTMAAGNFIGLIVSLEFNNETIVVHKKQKILLNTWVETARRTNLANPLKLKKAYHALTTNPNATSYQRVEISVVMCTATSKQWDSWNGKLMEDYSAGFYSFGLRTYCTIKKIISVQDLNGDEAKFEEGQPKAVSKGQKATLEVTLAAPSPLTLFDRKRNNAAYSNGEGRCCLIVNSTAIAIGIVTKLLA